MDTTIQNQSEFQSYGIEESTQYPFVKWDLTPL